MNASQQGITTTTTTTITHVEPAPPSPSCLVHPQESYISHPSTPSGAPQLPTFPDRSSSPIILHPEHLEQMFLKVEREAELRAETEAEADRAAKRASLTPSTSSRPGTADGGAARGGRRRGGSVSVSRFGAPIEGESSANPSRLSVLAMQNPLYQASAQAQASRETIASSLDTDDSPPISGSGAVHNDDEDHTVKQVQRIPGRSRSATLTKAVGAALGKRLSRATSRDVLQDVPVNVSVGVTVQSVEEIVNPEDVVASSMPNSPAAVDTPDHLALQTSGVRTPTPDGMPMTPPATQTTTTIVSTGTAPSPVPTTTTSARSAPGSPKLKRERSRLSVWADKFVSKLRRKSREDLSHRAAPTAVAATAAVA